MPEEHETTTEESAAEAAQIATPSGTASLADYQLHEKDTGSASYQVALLTGRITHLTEHLKTHKKDFSSRRGLLKLVASRRKFLEYIRKGSEESYKKIIKGLGLRK